MSYSINHNLARIRIESYNSLPIEKTLVFHNVTIFIESVFNKNKNHYYNLLLEKGLYENKSYKWMFVCYKCYILIELTFLKEMMLIRQLNQECDIFHYWYFLNKGAKLPKCQQWMSWCINVHRP